jgi:ferrous iron transport protein B
MSEDEQVTRDILLLDPPEAVLQIADAKNLKRAIFLTLQLAEMRLPTVLSLNMWDEAADRHLSINVARLQELLGIDVVPTVAIHGKGLPELMHKLRYPRIPRINMRYDPRLEHAIARIIPLISRHSVSARGVALMILSNDPSLRGWILGHLRPEEISEIRQIVSDAQSSYARSLGYVINEQRMQFVGKILEGVVTMPTTLSGSFAEGLARVTTHPLLGLPLLVLVLLLMYLFVGRVGAIESVNLLEEWFEKYLNPSLGEVVQWVSPSQVLTRFLIGEYGIITMALTYAFAIILPIVVAFFLFFGLLEDSGYLPRIAVLSNRVFKFIGLNGKAVLPMLLGLGCGTMATLTTRILQTQRERIILTFLLALGVPCSAQLGVIWAMAGGPFTSVGLVWFTIIVGVILFAGYLADKVFRGRADFLMELPPLRFPLLSNILIKTWARLKWYLREAVPLFVIGTTILFLLSELGLLVRLKGALNPIVQGALGLPPQATEAFILGFLRRDYGAAGLFMMQNKGMLSTNQVAIAIVTITLFAPCIAQFLVMIRERGAKIALAIATFTLFCAFGIGGTLNLVFNLTGIRL